MPTAASSARVGGLAVALGIGAALLSGVDADTAWADESAGSPGASASEAAADGDAPSADAASQAGASDVAVDDDNPSTERKAAKRSDRRFADAAKPTRKFAPSSVGDDDSDAADDHGRDVLRSATEASADRGDPDQAPSPTMRIAAATSIVHPDAPTPRPPARVGVIRRVVSGVVSAVLRPFAAHRTPAETTGAPLVWSLLAYARREFDSIFTPPAMRDVPRESVPRSAPADVGAEQRTLILSAFPAEADAVLARTILDPEPAVVVDGHHFYLGSMGGKKVIVGMTGIGMQNATATTEAALQHFTSESGISIDAVVFSGVAGGSGRTQIGSVAVPARWTSDDGETWHPVDADMLAAATGLTVDLESTATLGNPLCLCNPLAGLPLVDLKREPQLFVGGDGSSDDNNNGVAFPAIPFGGDIFGPAPCSAPDRSLLFTGNFFAAIVPFIANGLLSNLTGLLMPQAPAVDAVDQETAAAQQVAEAHGIPFLGIRGMSDGPGDPLGLPGYPFTFAVYRQLAADNAAIVTEAFLENWDGVDD